MKNELKKYDVSKGIRKYIKKLTNRKIRRNKMKDTNLSNKIIGLKAYWFDRYW